MRLRGARHHKQAAGVLVEPMYQSGARHACEARIVSQQRVLEGVFAVAGARVNHETGGLVKHQQCRVLVDDIQRQGLGRDAGLEGKLRPYHESLAAADPVSGPYRPAVDADGPRADPALQPRPGILGKCGGQRLIEAHAGRSRRQV